MTIRDKRKRRLLVFLAAALLLGTLAAGGYLLRNRQLEMRSIADREQGLLLLEQGDYRQAMHKIGPYVRRHGNDAETLYSYAVARENVPEPDNRHLSDAMGLYRRILALRPDHAGACAQLLGLYRRTGFDSEALDLTQRMLDRDPADAVALRARAEVLFQRREFTAAGELALRLADIEPLDIEAQSMALEVMLQGPDGPAKVLDRARELRERHAGDPRFELLQSIAFSLVDRPEEAIHWARQAAAGPVEDAETLRLLVGMCDRLGLFGDSLKLLQASSTGAADPEVLTALAERLFQMGQFHDVLKLEPPKAAPAADLEVIRALALVQLERWEEARDATSRLRTGPGDAGRAWKPVLELLSAETDTDAVALMKQCRQALASRPADPHLQMIYARALADLGETDAFVEAARAAATGAPAWHRPLIELSEWSLRHARWNEALQLADLALRRSPDHPGALYVAAVARTGQADPGDAGAVPAAIAACDSFEAAAPGDARVTPLRVRLAAGDPGRSRGLVEAALAASPAAPAEVLLELAELSRQQSLELEQGCFTVCEEAHGLIPALAYLKARHLHQAGQSQEAREMLDRVASDSARHAEATGSAPSGYAVMRARYLDVVNDPGAAAAWRQVADANPQDVALQWQALGARFAAADHAFTGRVLARLKERIGDQGINWRLARARWLLSGKPGDSNENVVEAALVLTSVTRDAPSLVPARLLLAEAMRRLGSWTEAIEQLRTAGSLDPASPAIALDLARALHSRRQLASADTHIERVLQSPLATPQHLNLAAELAVAAGDVDDAIRWLEARDQPPSDLLMAYLYWEDRRFEEADALCAKLVTNPDAEVIGFVARYYVARGRPSEAATLMETLDPAGANPAAVATVRGDYAASTGDVDSALAQYARAAAAEPGNATPWRKQVRLLLRAARFEQVASVAADAETAFPGDPVFSALSALASPAAEAAAAWPEAGSLLAWLLDHPEDRADIATTLDILCAADKGEAGRASPGIHKLAATRREILPLQHLAARLHLENGNPRIAAEIAGRAMLMFPADPASARIATLAYSATERWSEAVRSGEAWRERAPAEAMLADLVISLALARQGDLRAASARVADYDIDGLATTGDRQRMAIHRAALAVASGDSASAAVGLRPMLAESADVRRVWLAIAAGAIQDPSVAIAWLHEIGPLLKAEHFGSQLSLVNAWHSAALRLNDSDLTAAAGEARRRLNDQSFSGGPGSRSAEHWLLLGMVNESGGDTGAALKAYRLALSVDERHAVAANNLAMLLRETQPDEALRLARLAATEQGANQATFLDTLAAVQESRGELAAAAESAERALALAPDSLVFKLRLARLLVATGESGRARPMLEELETSDRLSAATRREVGLLLSRVR